jgi:hypothetical protein
MSPKIDFRDKSRRVVIMANLAARSPIGQPRLQNGQDWPESGHKTGAERTRRGHLVATLNAATPKRTTLFRSGRPTEMSARRCLRTPPLQAALAPAPRQVVVSASRSGFCTFTAVAARCRQA